MSPTEIADKKTAFSAMLDKAVNASPRQQNEIANEIGYPNANIMTMFKRGMTRVPLDKVVKLARAIDGDPGVWVRMWFEAYMPGCLEEIEPFVGFPITPTERSWVRGLRKAFSDRVPTFKPDMLNMSSK